MISRKKYLVKVAVALTLSLLLTVLLMVPVFASNATRLQQDDPYRIETFNVDGPGNLEVRTSGGHISVEGSSGNSVRVEMFVRKNGRNLMPEDTNLGDWDIDISQSGNTVRASAKREDSRNWSLWGNNNISISFVVHTPRDMSTDLKTSGGHIEVSGLEGDQEMATSGGHLNLSNIKGKVDARTSGGHIEIAALQGDIDARTSGGHIDVSDSEGTLKVKTSGGHIKLTDVSGSIEASTSGGNIIADLDSIGQFVDLRTSGGNVNINLPGSMGLDLNLRGSYVKANLQNFSGTVEHDEVEGKLNGGGPKISARTSGGMVSLQFKQ